jgi:hypothetical protein
MVARNVGAPSGVKVVASRCHRYLAGGACSLILRNRIEARVERQTFL